MFAQCHSNSSGRDLVDAVGEQQVQYGVTRSSLADQTVKLAFANPEAVGHPGKGARIDV